MKEEPICERLTMEVSDVIILRQCSDKTARRILRDVNARLGRELNHPVTIREFCVMSVRADESEPQVRRRLPVIRLPIQKVTQQLVAARNRELGQVFLHRLEGGGS